MHALGQVIPLLAVLFLLVARGNLRKFFLLGAIVTLPFRTDWGLWNIEGHNGWISGLTISISDVLFVCFWIQTWLSGRMNSLPDTGIPRSLVVFAVASALSMINSTARPTSLMQVSMILQVLLVNYVCMARCVNQREEMETALLGVSLSLALQGLIACAQFGLQQNFLLFSTGYYSGETIVIGEDEGSTFMRVFGTVGKPNGFAMFLVPLLLTNVVLLADRNLPGRKLRVLSVFLGFWGLVFSGSRGGWLSCSAALLVYFMFAVWRHKARRMQLLGGAIVLTVLVSLAAGPLIMTRLSSDDRNAAGSRIPIIGIAFEMIRAHPILGVGVNTYHSVMRSYVPKNYEADYVDQVHNTYLLVLAEMGIVGFVAAFYLMRNLFREAVSCFRTSVEGLQGALGLGLMLVLVQVLVHSMVEAYIAKMPIASLLVLAGLTTAARRTD